MAQSQGMSNHKQVGMEGIITRYYRHGSEHMEFFSFLSSKKVQNAKTSYMNTCQLIQQLQSPQYRLLTRFSGAMLYEQSDGCSAQYTSGTAIWCAIVIANHFGIIINRMITAPQHGKGPVDPASGSDKNYAGKHYIAAPLDEGTLDNYTMDEDDNEVDPALQLEELLSDPSRTKGLAGDRHKRKEGAMFIEEQHYKAIDWNKMKIPIPKTTFVVKDGLPKTRYKDPQTNKYKTVPYDGVTDHYHIYADWRIPGQNQAAMRRIPCDCEACHNQLNTPWDESIPDNDWQTQPRFQSPVGCVLEPALQGLNEWKFVTVGPT